MEPSKSKNPLAFLLKIFSKGKEISSSTPFSYLIEAIYDPAMFYDDNFLILAVNKAFEKFFDISHELVVDKVASPEFFKIPKLRQVGIILFPSLGSARISNLKEDSDGEIYQLEMAEDQKLVLRVSSKKVFDQKGRKVGNLKVIQDITRQANLEKSQEDFLNLTAHQFRTPLNETKWLLESLKLSALSPDDQKMVSDAISRLSILIKTINTILTIVEAEGGKMKLIPTSNDLNQLLEETIKSFEILAQEKGVQLTYEKPAFPIIFKFDRDKLYLALFNLTENAIRYNQPGGKVVVKLEKNPNRSQAQIKISDTGIGINKEDLPKLFNKFFRAKNAVEKGEVEGAGLGLYLVKKLIEAQNGQIQVESELGKGTSFTILLPTQE